MKRGLVASVLVTTIICLGSFAGVLAANWRPFLGLDLRGGLSVVYCPAAKGSLTKCATGKGASKQKLDSAVEILQNRANAYGVSQPNIEVQGNDVVVQLPGVKNARKVLVDLGSTAQLYFRPVLCYAPAYSSTASTTTTTSSTTTTTTAPSSTTSTTSASSSSSTSSTSSTTSSTTSTTTSSTTTTSTTAPTHKKHTKPSKTTPYKTPPSACPSTLVPSASSAGAQASNPGVWSELAAYKTTPPALDNKDEPVILPLTGSPGTRYLLGPSQAAGNVIASANTTYSTTSGYVVNFTTTGPGEKIWDDLANNNYLKLVATDLGGVVVSPPPVIQDRGSAFGSSGEISGSFTQAEANSLSINLNYGALPISLAQVTSQIVSPSLGASSLHAGLLAGLLGLLLVMLYTIFYYRALGIVVVLGLATTAALLYAIISALGHSSFGLTLDLSGITGLIVSVGITVDSYVVYFERLKDEVRAGRSIRASVDRGFKSAYRTILSADAVSFIGALVLWWLSVGAVRGFAFMLGLSTIIDVLTAYFFTRPLVILLGRNRTFTEARGLGVARGLAASTTENEA